MGPFKATASLSITALDSTTLLVYANPVEQFKIAKFVAAYKPGAKNPEKKLEPVGPDKSGAVGSSPSCNARLVGYGYQRKACTNLQR